MTKIAKLDFNALLTDEQITLAIGEVKVETETTQARIHQIIVAVGVKWATDGDIRPAVKHMNNLIEELGAGIRKNALVQYATSPKLFGMILTEDTKVLVAGKMKGSNLDVRLIANTKWFDFREPPAPKEFDVVAEYKKFVAKATTRSAKGLAIDKLNPEFLAQMVDLAKTLEAADIGAPN